MQVCVLTPVLDTFKGGNHLPLFAACNDVEFTVLTNRVVSSDTLPQNVTTVALGERIGPYYYGAADFLYARAVLRKFPPTDPFWKQFDVIHINQVMGPALRRLRKTGIPTLFLIHHPVTADREIAIAESSGFASILWRFKYAFLVRWQRAMCHAADSIATVSHTMRTRISTDYGCPLEKIGVIPNGVDGSVFLPVADSDCEYDIAAVGSFVHPRKGFRYLVELYRSLASSGYRIADVGRRTDAQREILNSLSGISVIGSVPQEQLVHYMRHSRVLVSTSLFEGFGLSLIEALSCGHPAFAFAVGAVPEVLGSLDASLVSPPRDVAAMTSAVQKFLTLSAGEREEHGKQYRNAVLEKYALTQSASALKSLYRQIQH